MKANDLISILDNVRTENNISINALAKFCGMQYPNVYNILHHRNTPRLDTFEKMLSCCGYTIQIVPCSKDATVRYYEDAALESRNYSDQWFRYLRKMITRDGCNLTEAQKYMLLNSDKLSMYQKVILKQALIPDSPTNKRVIRLNERVKTKMIDEIRQRHNNDQR